MKRLLLPLLAALALPTAVNAEVKYLLCPYNFDGVSKETSLHIDEERGKVDIFNGDKYLGKKALKSTSESLIFEYEKDLFIYQSQISKKDGSLELRLWLAPDETQFFLWSAAGMDPNVEQKKLRDKAKPIYYEKPCVSLDNKLFN